MFLNGMPIFNLIVKLLKYTNRLCYSVLLWNIIFPKYSGGLLLYIRNENYQLSFQNSCFSVSGSFGNLKMKKATFGTSPLIFLNYVILLFV
jgi:hypothetical protein